MTRLAAWNVRVRVHAGSPEVSWHLQGKELLSSFNAAACGPALYLERTKAIAIGHSCRHSVVRQALTFQEISRAHGLCLSETDEGEGHSFLLKFEWRYLKALSARFCKSLQSIELSEVIAVPEVGSN